MGLDTKQEHEISLFSKEPKPTLWSIQAPYSINNVGALSLRVKQPGHEADHSLSSSAKCKNRQNYTSNSMSQLYTQE